MNLEAWDIASDRSLESVVWVDDPSLDEEAVQGNTELELTPEEARALAAALIDAATRAEQAVL